MNVARLKCVDAQHELYDTAKELFEKANTIQAGSASYNLACILALRGDKEGCLKALQYSNDKGFVPEVIDIVEDPDLGGVKNDDWFVEFVAQVSKKRAEEIAQRAGVKEEVIVVETVAIEEESPHQEIVAESPSLEEVANEQTPIAEIAPVNVHEVEVANEQVKSEDTLSKIENP